MVTVTVRCYETADYNQAPIIIQKKSVNLRIYFSVVQRKALVPNDSSSLAELEERLLQFQSHYEQSARPFFAEMGIDVNLGGRSCAMP